MVSQPKTELGWSSGIADVFEAPDIACVGCVCPCALAASMQISLVHDGETGPTMCQQVPYYLLSWIPCVLAHWRGYMRQYYQIEGSSCEDCAVMTVCVPCAVCQQARHWEDGECDLSLIHISEPTRPY
eukprot:TRINITY_DN14117_c0_g1_i2.p1 TRINITY_DN14117_c0_g1~~TRINITY_DN14117_c0_g1_i2.p1  ORF type:complete len:128 (-),score=13.13 TRINITY_DN14117_c0_g1_i2:87-470(-)